VVPLKHFKTQSRISLEISKQCSLNLAPEMYITKETKWHPLCCCHDNSYAAGPVLIKTNITRFYLKQGSSTPNNLMGRVESIWESCPVRNEQICSRSATDLFWQKQIICRLIYRLQSLYSVCSRRSDLTACNDSRLQTENRSWTDLQQICSWSVTFQSRETAL